MVFEKQKPKFLLKLKTSNTLNQNTVTKLLKKLDTYSNRTIDIIVQNVKILKLKI